MENQFQNNDIGSPEGLRTHQFSNYYMAHLLPLCLACLHTTHVSERTQRNKTASIGDNVYLANRPRRPFPVTNSYFGARKALLGRFV
uniref:hypothetical protein n=1 Tax=Phocaeicola sp. TaxID=2773926 RepID=UPI003FEEF767